MTVTISAARRPALSVDPMMMQTLRSLCETYEDAKSTATELSAADIDKIGRHNGADKADRQVVELPFGGRLSRVESGGAHG